MSLAGPAAGSLAVGAQAGGVPLAAVWKEQRLNLSYAGRTSRYSCEGLRDKLRAMLLDLGARRDLQVTAAGCDASTRSNLRLWFSSPVLAQRTLKPRHEGELAEVDARFEAFTISNDAFRNMGIGDCELVQEFVYQVLPKLETRNLTREIICIAAGSSANRFLVRGRVLKAVPHNDAP